MNTNLNQEDVSHEYSSECVGVSILIPCLNEASFIERVIDSLLNQDFPQERMEVLFLDGGSTDATRAIIHRHMRTNRNFHLIHNHHRFVPHALNRGIELAKGEIIIRLDAHADYPPNYISKLIEWQGILNAENIGGVCNVKPRNDGLKANAIARVLSHPFGVGDSTYRWSVDKPTEVDTVPFGCFPKMVFDKFGMFDQRLHRNQDIELNKRLIRMGGKVILVPEVSFTYFARDTYTSLWKNNFANGKWVVLTAKLTKSFSSLSLRHFVPLAFLVYLTFWLALTIFEPALQSGALYLLCSLPLLLYLILISVASIHTSWKANRPLLFLYLLPCFIVLHISYGLGSMVGLIASA